MAGQGLPLFFYSSFSWGKIKLRIIPTMAAKAIEVNNG
jgi:hypothetical protein